MEITVEHKENRAIVKLEGELNIFTAPEFERRLKTLHKDNNYDIIVDLEEVPYVDSTGLATLISAKVTSNEKGGDLKLLKPNRIVSKVLAITYLDRTFEIYTSIEKLVESYK